MLVGAPKVVVIASRFTRSITQRLVRGARGVCARWGIPRANVRVIWVPGAFELPAAAAFAAERFKPDAIVALGCVIKGDTPQYTAIGQAVAHGLTQVSVTAKLPVSFGVIIADSLAQAKARAGGAVGNRGQEAAEAALELVETFQGLSDETSRDASARPPLRRGMN